MAQLVFWSRDFCHMLTTYLCVACVAFMILQISIYWNLNLSFFSRWNPGSACLFDPHEKTPQVSGRSCLVPPGISNCKAQTSPVVTVVGANFRKTIFEPLAHGPFPNVFFSGSGGWGAGCKTSDRCHRVLAVGSDRQIRCVDLGCMMYIMYAHLCVWSKSKLSRGRLRMF